jgi:predicted ATPase
MGSGVELLGPQATATSARRPKAAGIVKDVLRMCLRHASGREGKKVDTNTSFQLPCAAQREGRDEARHGMIHSIRIQDFKGHRDTTVTLGRLTLLVGPNGSGKTSVLEALELERHLIDFGTRNVLRGNRSFEDIVRRGASNWFAFSSSGSWAEQSWSSNLIVNDGSDLVLDWQRAGYRGQWHFKSGKRVQGDIRYPDDMLAGFGRAVLYKFNAAKIAKAAYSDQPGGEVNRDGSNAAVALAAMKLENDEAFARIEEDLRSIVRSVKRLRLRQATVKRPEGEVVGSQIYFDFHGAPGVPANCASEGTLITLALLTVLHGPNRPNLILLDDFDQSLHPRAQMELVTLIKRLLDEFQDLQIVATTHSPYILDQLEPSDVHVFALRDDGTVATRPLSEHPEAAKMKGALTTGQIWTLDQERSWVVEG